MKPWLCGHCYNNYIFLMSVFVKRRLLYVKQSIISFIFQDDDALIGDSVLSSVKADDKADDKTTDDN